MRPFLLLSFGSLLSGGCRTEVVDVSDGFCAQQDMMIQTPDNTKCAAAKGLTGDNLLCVDFTSSQVLSDLTNTGWNFDKFDKGCWTVSSGKLQINTANFATYMGTCGFVMSALSASDYGKYNNFTLSVVHRVDISDAASQKLQVMLGIDDPSMRLVTQWTGKQSRQQSTMGMSKNDLPNGGTGVFQPLFKLNASLTAGGTAQGWQIESIAVNASP